MNQIINREAIKKRNYWIDEIIRLSGNFGNDSDRLDNELNTEIEHDGIDRLVDHLRLCGDIPEQYTHDSSEEKLYSKYTDSLLCASFNSLGLKSIVLSERADAADVEAYSDDYSFVADAKSFRLSRTAKNQKDFKVQAIDGWKRGKPYAMVVCPIYQLPNKSSQIYQQATSRNVCIFTYSHLAVLVKHSVNNGKNSAQILLHKIFDSIPSINPTKDANAYWYRINTTMLEYSKDILSLWQTEKIAAVESIGIAKNLAINFLTRERERIMMLNHAEALNELVRINKIDSRIQTISNVSQNNILEMR